MLGIPRTKISTGKPLYSDKELTRLSAQVHRLYAASPLSNKRALHGIADEILQAHFQEKYPTLNNSLKSAFLTLLYRLLCSEPLLYEPPELEKLQALPLPLADLIAEAQQHRDFLKAPNQTLSLIKEKLLTIVQMLTASLPPEVVFTAEQSAPHRVSLTSMLIKPKQLLNHLLGQFLLTDPDQHRVELFKPLARTLNGNLLRASGATAKTPDPAVVVPADRQEDPLTLVSEYFAETAFQEFFHLSLPYRFPVSAQMKHSLVVGQTGHGKSMWLLADAHSKIIDEKKNAVVSFDNQGDTNRLLATSALFDPDDPNSHADRLIIIDGGDVINPPALSLFDLSVKEIDALSPERYAEFYNSSVQTYRYIFSGLLNSDLTPAMDTLFTYLAHPMLRIPESNLMTFLKLMQNPEDFQKYIDQCDPHTREFFKQQLKPKSYRATREAIAQRIWNVMANPAFNRLFSAKRSKINLFEALNDGKIILINSAMNVLGEDGSKIFTRFFLAMINQACLQRQIIPEAERTDTYVYLDECQDSINGDPKVERLLRQGRKYRLSINLLTQNFAKLDSKIRDIIATNTIIKLAGGLDPKEAAEMAANMRCPPQLITNAKLDEDALTTEFAARISTQSEAFKVTTPLLVVHKLPRMKDASYATLLRENRKRYCVEASGDDFGHCPTPATENMMDQDDAQDDPRSVQSEPGQLNSDTTGQGSSTHRALQTEIRDFATDLGLLTRAEKSHPEHSCRVDLAIRIDDEDVAVQVCWKNRVADEAAAIQRILEAGYRHVYMTGLDDKHLDDIEVAMRLILPHRYVRDVSFLPKDNLLTLLRARAPKDNTSHKGWSVTTESEALDDEEARKRKAATDKILGITQD